MSEIRLLAVLALSIFSIATSSCGPAEESSPTSPAELATNEGTHAENAPVDVTPRSRWLETATLEELIAPQGLEASLLERFGDDAEIVIHEIAAVDREGERPQIRVYGEAVVEVAFDEYRILTMVVLMHYRESKPIRWQDGILSPCQFEPCVVTVTNEPTDEELAWFRESCRVVRSVTMAGAADEQVPFRYGYVNPQRTWPKR